RLSRLRRASESALTRSGLVTSFPETDSRDELGDVARSFSTLLQRLNEYTSYLRTLAGKLAHEIRTPLTIVRSSLDNLESEQVPASARAYLTRARQGSERLSAILIAMGAATRVDPQVAAIEVENPGPPLPELLPGRLFESLWQSRTGTDSQPHFGLGLYIVRLIAEFHGGEASAANLADGSGVRVSVRIPR